MSKRAKTKDSCNTSSVTCATPSKRVRYVPFARGFKPRNENARNNAIGFGKASDIPKEFSSCSGTSSSSSVEFFKPIPQPTSQDDWLAQYDEDGQTYKQFLEENPWFSHRKVKYINQKFCSDGKTIQDKYPDGKVCIIQLGEFDQPINFSDLVDYASRFLCLPVEALPPLELEVKDGKVTLVDDPIKRGAMASRTGRSTGRIKKSELHSRYNAKTGHLQLRVDSVLSKLRMQIPANALCLIALTTLDLYGDASDLFVAGMAAGNQRVAVFSLRRYDPSLTFCKEYWYKLHPSSTPVSAQEKSRLLLQRSCKLVVHEISHLLGVDHCVFFDCCMNGSGHLMEDFRQPMHLCPVDLRKLHTLVGFDIRARYKSLLEFYRQHGLEEEEEWVQQRLEYLK
ncbi:hypothetical protein BaRGS_00027125 [Batillaria attramentaria]|uniref:Archaemetzincin-2 n=1 Tax=Batillaria attramentaria TaxID=370345 RepID=A0ABD0K2Y1_9CAEN